MKSFKITSTFVLLITMGFVISSCDITEERDRSYQGPAVVEFFPLSNAFQAPPATNTTVSAEVQLIGAHRDEPINVTINVVDSLTTAEEDVHYSIVTNSVTIAADSSVAEYPLVVDFSQLQPNEAVTVTLRIQDDEEINNNIDEWEVTLIGEAPDSEASSLN